jgi:hypothetical protein
LADDHVTRYFIANDAWVEQAKLTAGDGASMDQFGASVSIHFREDALFYLFKATLSWYLKFWQEISTRL